MFCYDARTAMTEPTAPRKFNFKWLFWASMNALILVGVFMAGRASQGGSTHVDSFSEERLARERYESYWDAVYFYQNTAKGDADKPEAIWKT